MSKPGYESPYTGQQVDFAVGACLALPSSGAIIDAVESGGYIKQLTPATTSGNIISFTTLSGGTSYLYDSSTLVTSIAFGAIVSDCRAQFKFTAGASINMMFPASCAFVGESAPASGSSYILAVNQQDIICVPYTETM